MKKQIMQKSCALLAIVCTLLLAGCDSKGNGSEASNDTGIPDATGIIEATEQIDETAQNEENPEKYTVTFVDHDGTVISEFEVARGEDAPVPENPVRDGYIFASWAGNYQKVTEDTVVTATYAGEDSPNVVCIEYGAVENGTVTATIRMKGEIHFCGFQTLLNYDESVLQFIEMTKYNGVEGRDVNVNGDLMITMAWAGFDNMTNDMIEDDGVLAKVVFTVLNPECSNTALTFRKDQTFMNTVNEDGSYSDAEYVLMDCVLNLN